MGPTAVGTARQSRRLAAPFGTSGATSRQFAPATNETTRQRAFWFAGVLHFVPDSSPHKRAMTTEPQDFYAASPLFDSFVEVMAPASYRPLPDDWSVGFADVVGSTQAVAQGRYKAVNVVGAGVIAAVANALDRRPFPFVFGGDGASFAVSGSDAPAACAALAAMADFSHDEFQLDLRVATIPVREIRAAGRDVKVVRYG